MSEEKRTEVEEKVEESGTKDRKSQIRSLVKEVLIYAMIFVAVMYFVPNYVCAKTIVSGPSMKNTLQDYDNVLLDKVSYRFGAPKRFDVVVFYHFDDPKHPDKKDKTQYSFYVKRIIGLPGETVQIKGETIYINGKPLKEDYGKDPITDAGIAEEPITLGDDEYFMLGDNRGNSTDSRDPSVGCVKRDWIVGKVSFRIYPFDSIGKIN